MKQGRLAARLRAVFYIALGNFVFPIFCDIAELVMIFRDPNFALHNTGVVFLSCYVNIIGVAFATLWTAHAKAVRKYDTTKISAESAPESPLERGMGRTTVIIGR
jgi:Trk-type K+ transport system membrane component